jgi:hypothetical protein
MKVLSLGWGVQSWTLAAMVALGELEPIDLAIHADTTWERKTTYDFAKRWTPWLEGKGVKVITTASANTNPVRYYSGETLGDYQGVAIPAFTINDGKQGQIRRQCTQDWKINAIRQLVSTELQARGLKKTSGVVEQWLGISEDEWHRAKDSDVKYITHRYPLLERGMRRGDCVTWLERAGLEVPGKSACVFCPYHNRLAWQEMKRNEPDDWEIALKVDAAIRDVRPPYPLFVHSSRLPLEEAVSIPEDHGYSQIDMFNEECDSGHCFL